MMKVKQNVKAQKDYGPCQVCGQPIEAGTQYQWMKGFRGPKYKRHQACPTWRMSEREDGPLSAAYAAQETANEALDTINGEGRTPAEVLEEIKGIVEQCAGDAQEAVDGTQESFDNMPEGLQQGDTGQMLEERISVLEDWISECESFEPEEYDTEQTVEEWADAAVDEARQIIDGLEA